jgi:hypothetical protein
VTQELKKLDETSQSVQAHLGIIQNVVQRMSGNSAACKTWCVTLVAAILVLVADKGKANLVLLVVLPIIIFAVLDVYYLQLEKGFRNSYNAFITKVHDHTLAPSDLYSVDPSGPVVDRVRAALKSFSVSGFYIPLLLLAGIAVYVIEPDRDNPGGSSQVPASRYQGYRDGR